MTPLEELLKHFTWTNDGYRMHADAPAWMLKHSQSANTIFRIIILMLNQCPLNDVLRQETWIDHKRIIEWLSKDSGFSKYVDDQIRSHSHDNMLTAFFNARQAQITKFFNDIQENTK